MLTVLGMSQTPGKRVAGEKQAFFSSYVFH